MAMLSKKKTEKKSKKPQDPKKQSAQPELQEPNLVLVIINRYFKWILVLTVGIVILLAYTFFIADKFADVQAAKKDSIPSKEKVLNDLRVIKKELDQVVIDFNAIRSLKSDVIDRLDEIVPDDSDYPQLFTMLDELTASQGLTMTSLNISMSETVSSQQVEFDERFQEYGVPPVELDSISALTINMSVEGGTYETFKKYLDQLERNIRLFDIRSISFSGSEYVPDLEGELGVPSYSIELTTYFKKQDT